MSEFEPESTGAIPGRFILVRAVQVDELRLLQEAASRMAGDAEVEIVMTGRDPATLERGGELTAFVAESRNNYLAMSGLNHIPRCSPELEQRTAQRVLRDGGSIVRLTILGEQDAERHEIAAPFWEIMQRLFAERLQPKS